MVLGNHVCMAKVLTLPPRRMTVHSPIGTRATEVERGLRELVWNSWARPAESPHSQSSEEGEKVEPLLGAAQCSSRICPHMYQRWPVIPHQ